MAEAPRRIAWFHCFSGIAGDMALGSLLDAGADLGEVRRLLERLPVTGWKLEAEPVLRGGIAATHVRVLADETKVVRTHSHIAGLEGVTALLAMLSSCAPGVVVVGIDNGYGAACAVVRLLGVGSRR